MENFRCNLLILGQPGAGKSTLLNYICCNQLTKTDTITPDTITEEGLYDDNVLINGQEVRIIESWGIEAGIEEQKTLIDNVLKEHNVQKPIEEWFHSVIYCIPSGLRKVEYIDSEIIQELLQDEHPISIVLTKGDHITEDDEVLLKKAVPEMIEGGVWAEKRGFLKVISACAVEKKTRSGVTIPFGKEDVQKAILSSWRETIINRMPKHIVARMCEEVDAWGENTKIKIGNSHLSSKTLGDISIYGQIVEEAKDFTELLQAEKLPKILKKSIESCHKTNVAFQKIFNLKDVDLDLLPVFYPLLLDDILAFIGTVVTNNTVLFNDLGVSNLHRSLSTKEQSKIEDFVDGLSGKMKEVLAKQEKAIVKIIIQSLKQTHK